ncbi:LITAF-like zinc ribbon domain-containing protein [Auriculariales sp. MPI-PUGE-AT-0066]|nr:LITAF-like zinc ribbon domain-containing protein [Auriculariales sp. MPI-PUGE-AT-0066]
MSYGQAPMSIKNLGKTAASTQCPQCGQTATTSIEHKTGKSTHIWAIITGVCCGMCCVPYLINTWKDVEHKCGSCGTPLAIWHRSGDETEVLRH